MSRRLLVALAAALALVACGDDDDAPAPPPATPLDPALGGTWSGTTTISAPGLAPFSYPSELAIAVSGQEATVSAICPDGSGSIVAQGSGRSAQWQGSFTCPTVALEACPTIALTHRSASLTLGGDGTLTANGSATASGCSVSLPVTLSFSGTR